MGLRFSYTLLSPIYDLIVAAATEQIRSRNLQRLSNVQDKEILINGVGTGLDIPHLPLGAKYTATDLTPAMLARAERRIKQTSLDITLLEADSMALPFKDHSFDVVVMHLILSVVPRPLDALTEACRVLKPDGQLLILDKFIQPGELALLRRLVNPIIRHIATRTDVVFEELLMRVERLSLLNNEPALLNGWFRYIELKKAQIDQ